MTNERYQALAGRIGTLAHSGARPGMDWATRGWECSTCGAFNTVVVIEKLHDCYRCGTEPTGDQMAAVAACEVAS